MTLSPGLHRGVAMRDYLDLDALGSTRLEWLARSPLYYRYMLEQPRVETDATALGTAVHCCLLEPDVFARAYVVEPDPAVVAPDNVKPRATKAYKDACAELSATGRTVLRVDTMATVRLMADAVRSHPFAAGLLRRAPDREVTIVWEREGRLCRSRADLLGDDLVADYKTCRDLRRFSPYALTGYGYHRQLAWERSGLAAHGRTPKHTMIVAQESSPPYDVGVFQVDAPLLEVGAIRCDELLELLAECEARDEWPGMFPEVQMAMLTDAEAALFSDAEVA